MDLVNRLAAVIHDAHDCESSVQIMACLLPEDSSPSPSAHCRGLGRGGALSGHRAAPMEPLEPPSVARLSRVIPKLQIISIHSGLPAVTPASLCTTFSFITIVKVHRFLKKNK